MRQHTSFIVNACYCNLATYVNVASIMGDIWEISQAGRCHLRYQSPEDFTANHLDRTLLYIFSFISKKEPFYNGPAFL
jgi:hypothetical protein